MIIRNRRKNESLLRRLFRRTRANPCSDSLLSCEKFRLELTREMYRSDRRSTNREFALIRMRREDSGDIQQIFETNPELLGLFYDYLRITDSFGWYDSRLAVLLPETEQEGAMVVANKLAKIGLDSNVRLDTELSIYPWDDELVSLSDELRKHDDDGNDSSDTINGNGFSQKTLFGFGSGQATTLVEKAKTETRADHASLELDPELVKSTKYKFVKSLRTPIWKRTIDVAGAGLGLMMLMPVFLCAAIAIKTSSKGPIFFKQMREGKDGKLFGILKFRTMVIDAEAKQAELLSISEQDGPAFKLKNDPRITGVGKYLRKSCIDELPQLVNVLIGEMSLVGPRPLPVHESYGCSQWQRKRLIVLPGVTCIWQARGGRDVKFAEWMRMDLEYIEQRSFWFDLKLIFETACLALMHKGSV